MIEGVIIRPLRKISDERGFFTEVFREDWKDIFLKDKIAQANLSISYPGMIRAWHRHLRGQVDYFIAVKGALKIGIFDEENKALNTIISTGEKPQVVRVPGHYWHGFKVVGNKPVYLLYFVNNLYTKVDPDEERRPWNDPTIIPESINGKKDDPRLGEPWDWNYPPHR